MLVCVFVISDETSCATVIALRFGLEIEKLTVQGTAIVYEPHYDV